MTNYDVVKKLVGRITPVGETNTDDERFENLKALTHLVELLILDIDKVACDYKDKEEFSVRRAGEFAYNFLDKNLGIV